MASSKNAQSFDEIIQANRQRKKNEALANEILGKGRKTGGLTKGEKRKLAAGPSLASRVGVTKATSRASSGRLSAPTPKTIASIEQTWGHDLHSVNNPNTSRVSRLPRESSSVRILKGNRLYDAVTSNQQHNGVPDTANIRGPGNGMSIRGLAGPYVVVGSNFASGTTSADIESAMIPIGGEMQSCRIITSSPTVIAEMVFTDKSGAENVIEMFNNKRADGRLLHVYMKGAPPTPTAPATTTAPPTITHAQPIPLQTIPTEPKASRPDLTRAEFSYDNQREQSDRNRRRADPEFQDGSYGFEARNDAMDVDMGDGHDSRRDVRRDVGRDRDGGGPGRNNRRLYSDDLYPPSRGRGFR